MPWTETAPMKERMRFVTDWERDLYSMVELCERYGVSRKTGYKWIARYEREGPDGLHERSRIGVRSARCHKFRSRIETARSPLAPQ